SDVAFVYPEMNAVKVQSKECDAQHQPSHLSADSTSPEGFFSNDDRELSATIEPVDLKFHIADVLIVVLGTDGKEHAGRLETAHVRKDVGFGGWCPSRHQVQRDLWIVEPGNVAIRHVILGYL